MFKSPSGVWMILFVQQTIMCIPQTTSTRREVNSVYQYTVLFCPTHSRISVSEFIDKRQKMVLFISNLALISTSDIEKNVLPFL